MTKYVLVLFIALSTLSACRKDDDDSVVDLLSISQAYTMSYNRNNDSFRATAQFIQNGQGIVLQSGNTVTMNGLTPQLQTNLYVWEGTGTPNAAFTLLLDGTTYLDTIWFGNWELQVPDTISTSQGFTVNWTKNVAVDSNTAPVISITDSNQTWLTNATNSNSLILSSNAISGFNNRLNEVSLTSQTRRNKQAPDKSAISLTSNFLITRPVYFRD